MRLIDANVPIYAVGSPHPYKEPCLRILEIVDEGNHDFLMDFEVLQEVLHVMRRRGRASVGFELVSGLIWSLRSIISIGTAEINAAIGLLREYPQINTKDAIHAAVVQLHGLEGVVSADRHFDVIRGVKRFDPIEMFPG